MSTASSRATEPDTGSAAPMATKDSSPFAQASPEARRVAAAILEVLAGVQGAGEAAKSLGISLPRYYQLEMRAVAGLVIACEDRRRRRGRGPAPGNDMVSLRRECDQLRRECARQQALARATRRTVGFNPEPPPAPSSPPPSEGRAKRRKRRPTARALKMATLLQDNDTAPVTPSEEGTPGSPPSLLPS